jgi:hypothetical protein
LEGGRKVNVQEAAPLAPLAASVQCGGLGRVPMLVDRLTTPVGVLRSDSPLASLTVTVHVNDPDDEASGVHVSFVTEGRATTAGPTTVKVPPAG